MKLTIGMPTHDDFHGVAFTIQSLRMFHKEIINDCEIIVVDNNPGSKQGETTKGFCANTNVRYIPFTEYVGSAIAKQQIFNNANGEFVLCMDSHVMLEPGSIKRLLEYYEANPDTKNLLQGPLVYDNLVNVSTHFDDHWRGEMWGTWGTNPRGLDPNGEPFEIPAQGMGVFSCRRDAWLGFNEKFRGFGGEEWYIHEKYRKAGYKCLCLPFLRWWHRFGKPEGRTYPLTLHDKIVNYIIGISELGIPLDRMREHFIEGKRISERDIDKLIERHRIGE